MKRFTAIEIILIIMTIAVSTVIVFGIVGIIVAGKSTEDNTAIRMAFMDLLKVITGGIFGAIGTLVTIKYKKQNKEV